MQPIEYQYHTRLWQLQNYKDNLPCILGFMCSNYGKQVVILKEITACSITGKDNAYIIYKYCN